MSSVIVTFFIKTKDLRYMSRLIYENIAIGVIIQRIAECRLINYVPNLQALLTQQTKDLEKKYRDMPVAVGDKIVVIEFKAPDFNGRHLEYKLQQKQINKLEKLIGKLDSRSVFVGLIHARLSNTKISTSSSGIYKFYAVPSTTVFIPAYEIVAVAKKVGSSSFKLKAKNVYPQIEEYTEDSIFPECVYPQVMQMYYLPSPYLICRTCGGICEFLCRYCIADGQFIELEISNRHDIVRYISLAQLLASLRLCRLGYKITDANEFRDVLDIYKKDKDVGKDVRDESASLVLIYSHERGITPVFMGSGIYSQPK